MKLKLSFISAIALAICTLSSCDNDPDNLYGKNKEMQILNESGEPCTNAYATFIHGANLSIVGGIGDNHIVEVEDESMLTATYSSRGAMCDGPVPTETLPAHVIIEPKGYGSTTVSITDTDIDKTIHVEIKVVDDYLAFTVQESNVEGLEKDMMLAFFLKNKLKSHDEYRIVSKEGNGYVSSIVGDYHFGDYDVAENSLTLTLINGETETTWKITDADNNAAGHEYYNRYLLGGLRLPNSLLTKTSPALIYPSKFQFTDTSNPERYFITGRADTDIKYLF